MHTQPDAFHFLEFQNGEPQIYPRFLSNIRRAGLANCVLPLRLTATVGLRLLASLVKRRVLPQKPPVIYLDSAHNPGETLQELGVAWQTLPVNGMLYGDDWGWRAVRTDVARFAECIGPASNGSKSSKRNCAVCKLHHRRGAEEGARGHKKKDQWPLHRDLLSGPSRAALSCHLQPMVPTLALVVALRPDGRLYCIVASGLFLRVRATQI